MRIVVCIKQVPDTTETKRYNADGTFARGQLQAVINPFDEYAIEEALRLKEQHGGDVTVLTMGPPAAEDALRKALAMGADRGVLVSDPALERSDWLATAKVLAAAIGRETTDLIMTGMESTDARTGLVPSGIAEVLNLPCVSYVSKLEIQANTAELDRQIPGGTQRVTVGLPLVVSVVKGVNEPRYPSLKGIMAAKRKEIQRLNLGAVGIDPSSVGWVGSKARITGAEVKAEKQAGRVLQGDEPSALAEQIADFLAEKKFI